MMKEKIFSLLLPMVNIVMIYLYDKEKIINIKEGIIKTKGIKNSEMMDILLIYIVITIIHIILLFVKNKYSSIGIGIIWLLFMIIYGGIAELFKIWLNNITEHGIVQNQINQTKFQTI